MYHVPIANPQVNSDHIDSIIQIMKLPVLHKNVLDVITVLSYSDNFDVVLLLLLLIEKTVS